jgi:hypothetical protein
MPLARFRNDRAFLPVGTADAVFKSRDVIKKAAPEFRDGTE